MENPGGYYVNLHTAKNPPGEMRGQLRDRARVENLIGELSAKVDALGGIEGKVDDVQTLLDRIASRVGLRP